jgi:hypothetical protein
MNHQRVVVELEVTDIEADELGAPEGAGETDQEKLSRRP